MFIRFLIFFSLIAFVEFYFLSGVKAFVRDFSPHRRHVILYIAYGFTGLSLLIGLVSLFYPPQNWNTFFRYVSSAVLILAVCKLLGISFLIIDDIFRLFRWLFSLFVERKEEVMEAGKGIPRLKFLAQLAVGFTVIPAIGFIYGMVRGAYKYRVHNVKLSFPNLPEEFHGFKIVQLSDIHVGSFVNDKGLEKAFNIVEQQKADLILFTGDLVNNVASETEGYDQQFKRLNATHGVYSVLGNHDYGDYVQWESEVAKSENLKKLKQKHAEYGWKLLMNEHVALQKNGQSIALLGIENWGGNMRFPRYGKMKEAHEGTEQYPFKILMSHDPSHWDMQVLLDYPDVDLTLSGHTHGLQFGIEIPGFKWSPVKYLYKNWAGLYKKDSQYLYVNRGLGFIGYPGRLGIWPEITVIELNRA